MSSHAWTALHRRLGLKPGPITDAMFDLTVENSITEAADLDFKSALPPTKNLLDSDLPKDIAAMANGGGGVLLYGISETDKIATGRTRLEPISEHHERALRSIAVTAIAPPVFNLGIHRTETGTGLVIDVPASDDGPHLIYRKHLFGAPIRNDADTVWMKEPQIEALYRARFDARRRTTAALHQLYDEVAAGRDTDRYAWAILVAVPRRHSVGRTPLTRDQAVAVFRAATDSGRYYTGASGVHPLQNTDSLNPRPGLRRWVAPNAATDEKLLWKRAWAAVHHDGAVSIAAVVGGHRTGSDLYARHSSVESLGIEAAVADFIALIRHTTNHFHIDEYETRIGIEWTGEDPITIFTVDQHGYPYDGRSTPLTHYHPVDTTVTTTADPDDYYRNAAALALDCINQGGISHLQIIHPPEPSPEPA